MNILDAIAIRKSRRAYLSDPIPPSILERLMELMAEFNREQGLSFRFIEDGSAAFASLARSYGMFSGVKALMVLAGKKDDPNRREKCGYFGERLVLEATAYGLGTRITSYNVCYTKLLRLCQLHHITLHCFP